MSTARNDPELMQFIGKAAIWTFSFREKPVQTLVRITDARRLWDRIDLEVETNIGSRVWASTDTVQIVDTGEPGKRANRLIS